MIGMHEEKGVNCDEKENCLSSFDEYELDQLIRNAGPKPVISEDCIARVECSVKAVWLEDLKKRKRRIFLRNALYSISACFVLVVASLNFMQSDSDIRAMMVAHVDVVKGNVTLGTEQRAAKIKEKSLIYTGQVISTDDQSGISLVLEGGQSLRLSEYTQMLVVSDNEFTLLKGRFYYDSGPDKKTQPIRVNTEYGVVSDIGTQFEVFFTPESMSIKVREGEVVFEEVSQKETRHVFSEQGLRVSQEGEVNIHYIASDSVEWKWTQELVRFADLEGYSLDQYLRKLVRDNGWVLSYNTQELENHSISSALHGSVDGMNTKEILFSLTEINDMNYEIKDQVLFIYSAD